MFNKLLLQVIFISLSANIYSNCNNTFSNTTEDTFTFINNSIILTATISANSICSGNSGIVTFMGTPNATITFTVDSGFNQMITLNSSGSFVLTTPPLTSNSTYSLIMISDGVTSAPLTSSATVIVNSVPIIGNTTPTTIICDGETTNIDFISNLPSTTFTWNASSNNVIGVTAGSGNSIEQSLTLINPVNNGLVTYTVFPSANGCFGSPVNFTVTVSPIPNTGIEGEISVSESSTTPIDLFSIITGEQLGGNWNRISGTGGIFNAAVGTFTPEVGATNSTFTYELTNNSSNCSSNTLATINIDAIPTGLASTTNQTINNNEFSNIILSSPNVPSSSFIWTFTANNINGASNGSGTSISQLLSLIDSNSNGYVDYTITPINNTAIGNTFTARVNILSPLNSESFILDNFKMSPNPVIDNLNIENDNQIKNVRIYNQIGQMIFSNKINDNKKTLDLSNLSSGIYSIFIETDTRIINKKIIKQ